jgi:hypothetical protein
MCPSKKNLDESQFEILEVWSGCRTKGFSEDRTGSRFNVDPSARLSSFMWVSSADSASYPSGMVQQQHPLALQHALQKN